MDFEDFLPEKDDNEEDKEIEIEGNNSKITEKITQNQVYDVITGKKHDWQIIIYDLISSEQLDPWDIDLIILTNKYFEKILEIEDDPNFYISSKVLLASAILSNGWRSCSIMAALQGFSTSLIPSM